MAGSALNVRIRRIEISQWDLATTANKMQLILYRLLSAGSGGSALSVSPMDPSDTSAGTTAMVLPSSKGTQGSILYFGGMYMMQTLGVSSPLLTPGLVLDFDRPRTKPLIIPAGTANGIAIATNTAVAGGSVEFNVWLDETQY